MSDTSDDSSVRMKKKSSFSAKFDKFSSKLHNPFKKTHSDSSDNEELKSPTPPRHEGSPASRRSGTTKSGSVHDPNILEKPPASGVQASMQAAISGTPTVPVAGETRTVPLRVPIIADAAERAAKYAPDGIKTVPPGPPSQAAKEVMVAKPLSGVSNAAKAGGSEPAGIEKGKKVEAEGAPAVAPAKKEYNVVRGSVAGVAEIVITGVKGDPEEAMKILRKRGFVVHLAMLHDDTEPPLMTLVLAMGPKLLVKSAVEKILPTKPRNEYTSREVSQLCAEAVDVIKRSGVEYDEVTVLHDRKALAEVSEASNKDVADKVFSYFGSYMGLYFAWLKFYTNALIVPTVAGIVLFLSTWKSGSPDGPLLPIFCVLVIVWSTLFLTFWRRRNSEMTFRWGVFGAEEEDFIRATAEKAGEFKANPAGKFCVTVPIIFAAIYAVIRSMLYCIWLSDNSKEVYGEDSYFQYFPLLLYSVVPIIASTLYTFLAKALNDFEDHDTAVRKKNMLVIKMFAFQFVNSYCALLYVAFWLKDLERLRTLLMTMMMVKQFIAQLVEKYQPVVMRRLADRKAKANPPKPPRMIVEHTGTVTAESILEELKANPADVEDNYLEMVLQFGYVSMFAVAFPLAPLFALLNNLWEIKLDLNMLVKTRRPQVHAESTIGAWQICLEVIGVVSCLTNLLLAVIVSKNVSLYVPSSWSAQLGTIEGKVVLAVVAEHLLLLLKAIMIGLIDKRPRAVREAQAVIALKEKEERKELHRKASGLPPSRKSKEKEWPSEKGPSPSDRLRALHETHSVWNFGPLWYMPLVLLPFIVSWFEMSPFLIIPAAFVFLSYLQHVHDKASSGLALGIVQDPKVLRMVTGFLPPWYTDSEVERVEWLNKIMRKMWVSVSAATKDLMFTTVQPIIDGYRPAGVSALGFKKVSLGTIPPKIVGVRALEMHADKAVFDVDIRWAANAEIVVEAGVKAVPLLITLDKLRFSGTLRVELAPLVPVFPCFGAVVVTFMEKPFLDFAFSLGRLDVMSIGPGEASVGAAVSNMIKGIVTNMMVFPQKLVIPILYEQDILALSNPTPTGVVELTLVGADNLCGKDITGKSDPYCKAKLGIGQEVRTATKNSTLNPRWEETFDLLVYERAVEIIEFNVYDRDAAPGDDDYLGHCELPLSTLKTDIESTFNLPLSKTKTGSLLIRATFYPLASGPKRTIEEAEDVIVDVAGDVITDEAVAGEVYSGVADADIGKDSPSSANQSRDSKHEHVDPSTLKPTAVLSDTSMGVLSVMGIECKGVKPGDRYVSVVCGNTKRKTPVEHDKTSFVYADVFHFLIKGAKSAVLEVLLKEEEKIGNDKEVGSFKVRVNEVIANEDLLDGEWELTGEKAQGSIKMRLKWSGRVGQDQH